MGCSGGGGDALNSQQDSDRLRTRMNDRYALYSEMDELPRSLCDPHVRKRRIEMLSLPHVMPLTAFASKLRKQFKAEVPDFDPLDGGIDAQVLFLFKKPGPMTSELGLAVGSGFISRNNDDATAEATHRFMAQAGIPRKLTVTWNVVPWWNGTTKVTAQELCDGRACLEPLLELLPSLSAVVLVGRHAASARSFIETRRLAVIESYLPTAMVRATNRDKWEQIPFEWAKVLNVVRGSR